MAKANPFAGKMKLGAKFMKPGAKAPKGGKKVAPKKFGKMPKGKKK